jgi:iron complex outermembrane receptor protein
VAHDINPVTYEGIRAEVLYQISDRWSALLAQSYQSVEAQGVFTEMAVNTFGQPQPPLTVQMFNPAYDKDRFENTSLTMEGQLGSVKALYAASYLVRNVEQEQDYTSYAHGGFYVDYYQCIYLNTPKAQCTDRT